MEKRSIVFFGLLSCLLAGIILVVANAREVGASAPFSQSVGKPGAAATAYPSGNSGFAKVAAPSTCDYQWRTMNSANSGTSTNYLNDIAIVQADDIWAVGYYYNASTANTLIEHWNGSAWAVVPSPNEGSGDNQLDSISAVSANDIWAVGQEDLDTNGWRSLIEHWNGSNWTVVVNPGSSQYINELSEVAVVSSNNVYAVGYQGDSAHLRHTLIEHWNGSNWTILSSPNMGMYYSILNSIAVVSSSDIWAVGYYTGPGTDKTLTEHWNGATWSIVNSPNPTSADNILESVYAGASNDVWAVGYYDQGDNDPQRTLIEHWNGASWTYVTSPNNGTDDNVLSDVVVWSSTNVWAVGNYKNSIEMTLTEHWDGTNWTIVPSPNNGTFIDELKGVEMLGSNDVWAVGDSYDNDGTWTLIERYNLACVSPTPTQIFSATPTTTPTSCPVQYSDVPQGSTFYDYVRCLACRGVINGYADGTFRPNNNVTRGQLAKIISNGAGFNNLIPNGQQTFVDVPTSNTFWVYVERVALHGVISGYVGDGATVNPCTGQVEQSGQHYFRPCNNATRGQIAKIDAVAKGYADLIPPSQQTFVDVPPTNTFWVYVERVALHDIIGGYTGDDHTTNPCTGGLEQNGYHYFRPCNNATRGQIAKIIGNTFFPNCQTPNKPNE